MHRGKVIYPRLEKAIYRRGFKAKMSLLIIHQIL